MGLLTEASQGPFHGIYRGGPVMALSRYTQRKPYECLSYAWRHLSIEKLNDGFSRIIKRMDYSTASMQ